MQRVLIYTISILYCWLTFPNARAQNLKPPDDELQHLFIQTLSLFPQEAIPSVLQSQVLQAERPQCATMQIAEVRRNIDDFTREQKSLLLSLFERPTHLDDSYISQSGFFKIHYTLSGSDAVSAQDIDNNGLPDYVEEIARFFEESFAVEIEQLQYLPPPDDTDDGPEYDVYIQALGTGVYGYTATDLEDIAPGGINVPTYISIDNDFNNGQFSSGLPGAQVAAAHEFFHAIQFGYRDAFILNEYFYYELCSSWMEDVVYDKVNDYYSTLPSYLSRTHNPFNLYERATLFNYGAAIWNHFLEKKYDDKIIRRSWELMRNQQPVLDAMDISLKEEDSSFDNEFAWFAVWNYFTGDNADTLKFYSEGLSYPEINFAGNYILNNDTTIVDSVLTLSYKYHKFTTTKSGDYLVVGNLDNEESWRFAAIIKQTGLAPYILLFDLKHGVNLGALSGSTEVIIIPVNLAKLDGSQRSLFNTLYSKYEFRMTWVDAGTENQKITNIYPNPFIMGKHPEINFEFLPISTVDLHVRILNYQGQVIKTVDLSDASGSLTPTSFRWNCRNESNELVASGIYIVAVTQNSQVQFAKFAVIHK